MKEPDDVWLARMERRGLLVPRLVRQYRANVAAAKLTATEHKWCGAVWRDKAREGQA